MSSLAAIRDAIAARLSTVTDIGRVHTYERYASNKTAFRAFYEHNGQIRGWFIRRLRTRAIGDNEIDAFGFDYHTWQLRGFMSLDDSAATEVTFDTLIEAVRTAFRADPTLGGVVASLQQGAEVGIQVAETGPVMLAGVLCHACRLELTTQSLIEPQFTG